MTGRLSVSLVAPTYNERQNVVLLAEEIFAAIERNAEGLKAKTDRSTWLFRAVLLEAAGAGVGVVGAAIAAAAT